MLARPKHHFIQLIVDKGVPVNAACRIVGIKVSELVGWIQNDNEFVLEWVANACLTDIARAISTGDTRTAGYAGAAASRLRNYIQNRL